MEVQSLCSAWGAGPDLRSADLAYVLPEVGRRPERAPPAEEHVRVHVIPCVVLVSAG